jgi:hypothetical protein
LSQPALREVPIGRGARLARGARRRSAAGRVFSCRLHATGPEQVLRYLSRYTHRIAISNRRIVTIEDERVGFTWKDYRDGGKQRRKTTAANRSA